MTSQEVVVTPCISLMLWPRLIWLPVITKSSLKRHYIDSFLYCLLFQECVLSTWQVSSPLSGEEMFVVSWILQCSVGHAFLPLYTYVVCSNTRTHSHSHTCRHTHAHTCRHVCICADLNVNTQTNRQTDRQTDRLANTFTCVRMYMHTHTDLTWTDTRIIL